MKKYSLLSLTDHSGHIIENSIYAILSKIAGDKHFEKVFVASRGNTANSAFFSGEDMEKLWAVSVSKDFRFDPTGQQFSENTKPINPKDFDIVLMRLPRPVEDQYLIDLKNQFSELCFINDPEGIVKCSSKAFLLNFPGLCPPMKLCYDIDNILGMAQEMDIVLKPLREYGGKGILKISGNILNDGNEDHPAGTYLKKLESRIESEGYLAMKFLKNVTKGDKRLIVVGGKILAASLRLPAKDSWLCNISRGGRSVYAEPDERERQIVKEIHEKLEEQGILIYGVDTLVDDEGYRVLSEINALSIGGFPQAEAQTGRPVLQELVDMIVAHKERKVYEKL